MIGFCIKQGQETVNAKELFQPQNTGEVRPHWWQFNENGQQVAVQYVRSLGFSAEFGPYLAAMQGYCHPARPATIESNEMFLIDLLQNYRNSGKFQPPTVEGCHTLCFVDGQSGKVFLYRNLVGNALTYYTLTDQGFFWGTNFAQLVRTSRQTRTIDESRLPILFLGRYPTGNKTLVKNVFRLQPGELVVFDGHVIIVQQVTTFADLLENRKTSENESIERIEAVTTEIMRDWHGLYPNTANLLSGGIDSTYLQVHWNAAWREKNGDGSGTKPLSTVVWLNHKRTKPDLQYTLTAAEATGCENIAVEQPKLTSEFLAEIIGRNGEFPNHVQSLYFDTLARGMRDRNINAGIVGEGADGLFGTGVQDMIKAAQSWKETLVSPWLINTVQCAARMMGGRFTADAIARSRIVDDVHNLRHPVNGAAVFTDYPTLEKCFGRATLQAAIDEKLDMLKTLNVPQDSLHLHWSLSAGYVWEAAVTASYWSQLFAENGLVMCSPFLDSRMIRAALNIDDAAHFVTGNPKQVLKKALLRHVSADVVNRPKLGFGQPIFEWLSPGGPLRERVEAIRTFDWFDEKTKRGLLQKPNWFLWTMLCYDIWYDTMID